MSDPINFFCEDVEYKVKCKEVKRRWIKETIRNEKLSLGSLNVIFCNDKYLQTLNGKYLKRWSFTDTITFQYDGRKNEIIGDIFISIERVSENALKFNKELENELCRVLIHGVLHLIGFKDSTLEGKKIMREKEDFYLSKSIS
ncbi:MAG: rRNA maturation RNase YbeY [Bacteroidota bacterium]